MGVEVSGVIRMGERVGIGRQKGIVRARVRDTGRQLRDGNQGRGLWNENRLVIKGLGGGVGDKLCVAAAGWRGRAVGEQLQTPVSQ